LVSEQTEQRTLEILHIFENKGVIFDAVYVKQHLKRRNNLYMSYSQIFEDFEISFEDVKWQALIVCAICLDNTEIKSRDGEELLFDTTVNNGKEFYIRNVPDPKDKLDVPVTLLIPHMLSQEENKCM